MYKERDGKERRSTKEREREREDLMAGGCQESVTAESVTKEN